MDLPDLAVALGGGSAGNSGSIDDSSDSPPRLGEAMNNDDGGGAAVATLPDFWWRALDVSMEDITIAMDAMWEVSVLGRGM